MNDRAVAWVVAGFGTAVYFVLAFGVSSAVGGDRFGTFVYNHYFLALTEGRFDVPLRVVTLEGHFDPAGRAYVYHGLAPLITRAMAWPLFDLRAVSLAPLTVWLAAAGGTAVYHTVFAQILTRFAPHDFELRRSAGLLLGIMVWFASPGLLLVVNDSLFQEPIAMAYLFVACFLALLAQVVLFQKSIEPVLLPLAIFAGLCVFARPHLAIGLYAVVGLLGLAVVWHRGGRGLALPAAAMAILLCCGGALLVFNDLRFGSMLQMHGAAEGALQHAVTFWGTESIDSPRMKAFAEHGRFNVHRTVPNLVLYLFDFPVGFLADSIEWVFRHMTSNVGYIRIEQPRIGIVIVWLPWFMLALAGIWGGSAGIRYAWAPVIATGVGGLLMASYATVTLRYRIDLWPVLAALAMLSAPRVLVAFSADQEFKNTVLKNLRTALLPCVILMAAVAYLYAFKFVENGLFSQWSFVTCADMVRSKQTLAADAVDRLCAI